MSTPAADIIGALKISGVYAALGGLKLRGNRGRAFWRDGDGFNVALNDEKGTWYDHRDKRGGGVLDLIVQVRGGSKADALRWLADFAGIGLTHKPVTAAERTAYVRERAALERDLPDARYWRRALVVMIEDDLFLLKAALFDASEGPANTYLIAAYERILARLRHAGDTVLVFEYRAWRAELPRECAALVRWARERERAEVRALLAYLGATDRGAAA
jgi:hypothetical protein